MVINKTALPQKRILIVQDYSSPHNDHKIKELYNSLRSLGYYVAVYVHGQSLEKSRAGIERRCKIKPFDLIVTLKTGCLVAGRVANCPRIMVDPDWDAWKRIKLRLGDDKKRMECRGIDNSGPFFEYYLDPGEVTMARQMAERSYIRRSDKAIYGWFTAEAMESDKPEEHLKRFKAISCFPDIHLDKEDGIEVLSRKIDNLLSGHEIESH